jgi:hypothetical protein
MVTIDKRIRISPGRHAIFPYSVKRWIVYPGFIFTVRNASAGTKISLPGKLDFERKLFRFHQGLQENLLVFKKKCPESITFHNKIQVFINKGRKIPLV